MYLIYRCFPCLHISAKINACTLNAGTNITVKSKVEHDPSVKTPDSCYAVDGCSN